MRNWRKQELAIGLTIGVVILLIGAMLVVMNFLPASADMLARSNAPLVTWTPSPSPTPTFTPTPRVTPSTTIGTDPLATPTRRVISAIPQGSLVGDEGESAETTTLDQAVADSADAAEATASSGSEAASGTVEIVIPSTVEPTQTPTPTDLPPTPTIIPADVNVAIDVANVVSEISPYIYGLSQPDPNMIGPLRPAAISWGGNASSRYNWREGNYWNSARDYEWRNGTFGTDGMVADQFLRQAMDNNLVSRLTIPTLGWVAKDWWSCSFMDEEGNCTPIDHYTDCNNPVRTADPYETSIPSTPQDIREWMEHIRDNGLEVTYAAMDNEPELWGFSHFDVHPNCTTYQEILDKYISYAEVVNEVLPETDLVGPATCCWHFYWQSAAGLEDKAKHGYQDFLPWFLSSLRKYEETTGTRLLDVLDIHYYPEGLYEIPGDEENEETMAQRLRSVRSLWDPNYVDESWVNEPVVLLPRMKALIDEYYPGTRFGISEWNFGAETTLGGALALADALGQFGIHDVEYAFYWRYPNWDTPAYNAFRMFTNYDWEGGHYGNVAVSAETSDLNVSSYAALNRDTGNLHIMLINKYPDQAQTVGIDLANFEARLIASQFRYDATTPTGIVGDLVEVGSNRIDVTLSPYSITQLILSPDSQ